MLADLGLVAALNAFTFTVSDDGTGFDAGNTPLGAGLRNMSDRLAALGHLRCQGFDVCPECHGR